ncbi:MAG: hypothetical protein KDI51_09960 [Xanthomonadales bacterium]|nr:hypothetical protein [Xanthomonadales bacterium]
MKTRVDFSNAKRCKFHRPNATLELPVNLDADVRAYLTDRGSAKGMDLSTLINDLIMRKIKMVKSTK